MEESDRKSPIFRDIRRYYCEFCGICRSHKSLITSHVLSNHQEEIKGRKFDEEEGPSSNICEDCGVEFKKTAHLKQHMLSHSLERSFTCPVDDCNANYRRKDHLNRHLLQREGKIFKCPAENCNKEFTIKGNMQRHLKEFHDEKHSSPSGGKAENKFICGKTGCGKEFKYESKLKTQEESHITLDSVEVFCADPSCMKPFTNKKCLNDHIRTCHQHVNCEICGTKQLRKNIKRHLCTHEDSPEEIKCSFKGCEQMFTTKSNLQQHINAVHLELRPYVCSFPGCGKRFPFKHVSDNHEKSSWHNYVHGDLEEFDEHFRARPKGGKKRKFPSIESLMRKRATPGSCSDSAMNDGADYLSWLLSVKLDSMISQKIGILLKIFDECHNNKDQHHNHKRHQTPTEAPSFSPSVQHGQCPLRTLFQNTTEAN
ncbi:hypothetical protein V2J09_014411 [Rumex salicifolius]